MGLFTSKPTPKGDILMTNGRHLSEVPAGFELIPAADALSKGRIVWGCDCKNKAAVVKQGEAPVRGSDKQETLKLMMQACMRGDCKGACMHEIYCSLFEDGKSAVNIAFAEAVIPVARMQPYRGGWMHQRHSKKGGSDASACHACGGNGALLSELASYTTNDTSEANIRFVNVALAAGRAAGLKIEGSSTKDQIRSFLDSIKSASGNAATCRAIAEAINKEAKEEIISTALEPQAMCQQITQFVSGWGGAMTGELVNAYVDLLRVVANNRFVINVFEQLIKVLEQHSAGIERANIKTDIITAVTAMQEGVKILKQQNGEISNLVSTHARPALRTLNDLAKKMVGVGDIRALSKNGADPLSKWLQNVLHLAGMESASAILVQQALSKIGVDSKEYVEVLRSRRFGDLPKLLLTPTVKAVFSSGDEANVLEALRMITYYTENAEKGEAMAVELEKKGGEDVSPYLPSEETKKVELEHLIKQFIFKAFARRINDELNEFEKQLDDVSKRIGKPDGIPVDPAVDDIADAASKIQLQLEIIRKSSSYLALTSYHNDAKSRSLKQQVVTDLAYFAKVIDDVISKPFYSKAGKYLVGLRDAAKKMIDTIEEFSQGVATRQGRTYDAAAAGGNDGDDVDHISGGGKGDFSKLITRIYKSPYETKTSIDRFRANVKLATVIDDLKRHGTEMDAYYEKYDSLVANSIANYLVKAREQNEHNIKLIDENLAIIVAEPMPDGAADAAITAAKNMKNWYRELVSEWKTVNGQQQQAKEAFWATVEAVDLYMKLFTQGIANNPEDVGDIVQMMNNVRLLKDLGSENFVKDLVGWFNTFTADGSRAFTAINTPGLAADGATGAGHIGPAQTKKGIEDLSRYTENFGTLKNLLSVFARICSNFGGVDAGTKVFMSPGRMYANLVKFLCCAAYTNRDSGLMAPAVSDKKSSAVHVNGVLTNSQVLMHVAARARVVQDLPTLSEAKFNESFQVMSGVPRSDDTIDTPPFYEMFPREFEYFEMIIKSISAKILVALGLRNVLTRPMNEVGYYKINNIRMILGGGNEIPQVNEKAIELYLRLPLLCQFYKKIFGYEESPINTKQPPATSDLKLDDKDHVKISFVPDIDGVFSGLIRLIFRKVDFIDPHAYSNEEIAAIINECNTIYGKLHGKYPENTIKGIIDALVSEVNRRYGLITAERRKKYEEEFGFRYDYYTEGVAEADRLYEAPTPANIQLLDGEGDEVARLSNAQRLLAARVPKANEQIRENEFISRTHRTLLEKFRKMIDKDIVHPEAESYDFKSVVKGTIDRVARESTPQGKFEAICMMIRSSDELTAGDYVKYMMFHETVVMGLNTLSAIHTFLQRFVNLAWFTSLEGLKSQVGKQNGADTEFAGNFGGLYRKPVPPGGDNYDNYLINADDDKKKVVQALLDVTFSIGNDFGGLVKVTFSKNHVHFNFGELKEAVSSLMETTANFIGLMRPILSKKEEYTRLVDPLQPGSLSWLRNHLYEKLILGRDRSLVSDKKSYISLDKVSELMTKTLNTLLPDTKVISSVYLSGIFFEEDFKPVPVGVNRVDFTDPLEKLHLVGNPVGGKQLVDMRYIFHKDFTKAPSLDAFGRRSLLFSFNQAIEKYLKCFFENDKIYIGLIEKFAGGSFAEDIRNIADTFADMTPGCFVPRGGVMRTSNTMSYADFLKSSASQLRQVQTADGHTLTPIYEGLDPGAAATPVKYPRGSKQILFMSLAHLIESIMLTKNSTLQTTYSYLVDNVADVPQYTREKMRANLPGFRDIFATIAAKCEMYRHLLSYFPVDLLRVNDSRSVNVYFKTIGFGDLGGEDAAGLLIESLKKIESGCQDFIASCDAVLKEIGDVPKPLFLETEQDSIKNFHAKTGQYPFAPLSMLLTILENDTNHINFMPFFGKDSPQFKFAYGTRGVLHAPSTAAQAPYMNYLLQTYNAVVSPGFIIDEKAYNSHLGTIIGFMRYIYRIKHLCVLTKIINKSGAQTININDIESAGFTESVSVGVSDNAGRIAAAYDSKASISLVENVLPPGITAPPHSFVSNFIGVIQLSRLVLMAESEDIEKQARKVIYGIIPGAKESKCGLIVQNILDLGIIPINVHAMARFIPLVHLMNYSYSFDRLVCELLHGYGYAQSVAAQKNLSEGAADSLYGDLPIRSSLDALRVSLIRPFSEIKPGERVFWANMMRGEATAKGLSRGKLLFELYDDVLKGYKPASMNILGQHEPKVAVKRITFGSYMGREIMGGDGYTEAVDDALESVLNVRSVGKTVNINKAVYLPSKLVQPKGTRTIPNTYIVTKRRDAEHRPEMTHTGFGINVEALIFANTSGDRLLDPKSYPSIKISDILQSMVEAKYPNLRFSQMHPHFQVIFDKSTLQTNLQCLMLDLLILPETTDFKEYLPLNSKAACQKFIDGYESIIKSNKGEITNDRIKNIFPGTIDILTRYIASERLKPLTTLIRIDTPVDVPALIVNLQTLSNIMVSYQKLAEFIDNPPNFPEVPEYAMSSLLTGDMIDQLYYGALQSIQDIIDTSLDKRENYAGHLDLARKGTLVYNKLCTDIRTYITECDKIINNFSKQNNQYLTNYETAHVTATKNWLEQCTKQLQDAKTAAVNSDVDQWLKAWRIEFYDNIVIRLTKIAQAFSDAKDPDIVYGDYLNFVGYYVLPPFAKGGAPPAADKPQALTAATMIIKSMIESGFTISWQNVLDQHKEFAVKWLGCAALSEIIVKQIVYRTLIEAFPLSADRRVAEANMDLDISLADTNTITPQLKAHVKDIFAFYSHLIRKYQMDGDGKVTYSDPSAQIQPYNGRLDSVFVRAVIFIQNVYRVTHLALRRSQKNESGDLIVEGIEGADADDVEYYQNETGKKRTLTRMFDSTSGTMKYGVDELEK